MNLSQAKGHLSKAISQIKADNMKDVKVFLPGLGWSYSYGTRYAERLQLMRRTVEWLITICGADADLKEVFAKVAEHPKAKRFFQPIKSGQSANFDLCQNIARNRAGYSILCAILANSQSRQDAAAQRPGEKGEDGEADNGQGNEQKDHLNPQGGSDSDSTDQGENAQGQSDSQSDSEDCNDADRGEEDSLSLPNASSNTAFWPEEVPHQLDAAARQAAALFLKKVKQFSAGNAVKAPLINAKRLVKELVTKRYNLSRIRGKAVANPKKTLIAVDVSGSCSASSPNAMAAAKAVYQAAPDLVVVMFHVNGIYQKHIGKWPEGVKMGHIKFYDGRLFPTVNWWSVEWGLIVSFGDQDSWEQEAEAISLGVTVLKLDSYAKNHTGFMRNGKYETAMLELTGENPKGRLVYCTGCDNAADLLQGLKLL